jgi:exopolysaccharide production protein ExoY
MHSHSSSYKPEALSSPQEMGPHLSAKNKDTAGSEELGCGAERDFSRARLLYRASGELNQYLALETSATPAGLQVQTWDTVPRDVFRRAWSYRVAKRILDLVLAVALLPVLLPVCLLLMLLIKCSSKGPIFYKHLRVGQDSRAFYLYKFRTMFLHDQALLDAYLASNADARREWDAQYKLRWDPRVTPVGAVLRRTSLDELPQVVNVLLGHMSFVGPRPIVHDEVRRYGAAFPFYAAAKPGITGLWQVSGRGAVSYEKRVSLDILYVTTWSFAQDFWVLLKTARAVCRSEGAY